VIRDSSKLAFFIHIRLANNANGHIRRIYTRRLIFVSIGVNSLAIILTKRTRITTNRAQCGRTLTRTQKNVSLGQLAILNITVKNESLLYLVEENYLSYVESIAAIF